MLCQLYVMAIIKEKYYHIEKLAKKMSDSSGYFRHRMGIFSERQKLENVAHDFNKSRSHNSFCSQLKRKKRNYSMYFSIG